VRQARAGFLPRVDLVEAWQGGNQPVFVFGSLLSQQRFTEANFAIAALNRPDPLWNHRAAVVVEQTLYDGSRTRASVSASRVGGSWPRKRRGARPGHLHGNRPRGGRALTAQATATAARAFVESVAEDLAAPRSAAMPGSKRKPLCLALRVERARPRSAGSARTPRRRTRAPR
jgi:hypothetical protein